MDAEKKILCACGCGEKFVPKNSRQIYYDGRHLNRMKGRRLRERAKLATKAGLTGRKAIA